MLAYSKVTSYATKLQKQFLNIYPLLHKNQNQKLSNLKNNYLSTNMSLTDRIF